MRTIDATGLHARDCECFLCDVLGLGPTEQMRAVAARALALQGAARRRIGRKERKEQERRLAHAMAVKRTAEMVRRLAAVKDPTPEEWADLERMRKDFRK